MAWATLFGLAAATLAAVASGQQLIPMDGTPVNGKVDFMGTPWKGYFTTDKQQRLTLTPTLTGDQSLRMVSVYVGWYVTSIRHECPSHGMFYRDYIPSGKDDQSDWKGDAVTSFSYPVVIDVGSSAMCNII